ncbi:hypothetical protein JL721_6483 [Aureococcus anophagefferens]|nr:hypothetical protein JL721_6483 [Aureococcus anophagefferens]
MAATMAIARAKRAAKRRLELQKLKEEKRMRDEEEVDMWLEKYDVNRDLSLQREELRKLLAELEPEAAPTDVAMDYVWTIAEALHKEHDPAEPETPHGGEVEEGVPRWKVRRVVARYREYLKRSKFLDEVFDRFDYDKSGKLEVEPPGDQGLPARRRRGHPGRQGRRGHGGGRRPDLQAPEPPARAKDKGILSERSLNAKWKNITGNTPSENVLDVDVTDGDVEFIIHNCDKNHDGAINRDEIFATISVWMGLLIDQKRREEARAAAAKKGSPGRELPLFETPKLAVPASGACSIM